MSQARIRTGIILFIFTLGIPCFSVEAVNTPDFKERLRASSLSSQTSTQDAADTSPQDVNDTEHCKVTFIELGSVRCIPCKKMQPIMAEIERVYADQVKVVFHDVWTDEGRLYAEKYGIRAIPTQIFLDHEGKECFRHEGFFQREALIEVLKQKGIR